MNIVPLHEARPVDDPVPPMMSAVKMLRKLADSIEAGEYGLAEAKERHGNDYICRCAVVLRVSNRPPQVFGYGPTDAAQSFMDLHAGAAEIMSFVNPTRG